MPNSEITAREIADGLRKILTDFDDDSGGELEVFNKFLKIKHQQLENHTDFLLKKFGSNSEKLAAVEKRLASDPEIFKSVEAGIELAKFNPPEFPGTGWRVQGFVYDSKGEKASGKKIVLVNEETKEPVKNIRPVVSGKNGYYSITLKAEEVKALKDTKLALALVVKDEDPFIAAGDLHAVVGRIDHQDIGMEQ